MGSHANSIHVQNSSPLVISRTIRAILTAQGYQDAPTDTAPIQFGDPSRRAVHIVNAPGEWVGVLDSDLMGSRDLALSLSASLKTHVLQGYVNDSDSWHYELMNDGESLDTFSSLPEGLEGGFGEGGFESEVDPGLVAEAQRIATESTAELNKKMPPDIAEISQIQMGQGERQLTPEDVTRYQDWLAGAGSEIMKQYVEDFTKRVSELNALVQPNTEGSQLNDADDRVSTTDYSTHVNAVRPILPADTSPEQLKEVLARTAVFAEEIYADFFKAIGVHETFAHLSYEYWDEFASYPAEPNGPELVETIHLRAR